MSQKGIYRRRFHRISQEEETTVTFQFFNKFSPRYKDAILKILHVQPKCFLLHAGPNFIETCLAWNFFLDKNRITTQNSICCILLVTRIQLSFAYPENHVEIWLVILFLSRRKFHAEQIFVLSSSMNLGPGPLTYLSVPFKFGLCIWLVERSRVTSRVTFT